MDPKIQQEIKELSKSLARLKKMAGVEDTDDPDLDDTNMEEAPPETKEVGRGRKRRSVPTFQGQLDKPDKEEEMSN